MAALTATLAASPRREVYGDRVFTTLRVTPGVAQSNEWIAKADLGVSQVTSILGAEYLGDAAGGTLSFVLNAQGTGQAENSSMGDLAIRSSVAQAVLLTVEGKAK